MAAILEKHWHHFEDTEENKLIYTGDNYYSASGTNTTKISTFIILKCFSASLREKERKYFNQKNLHKNGFLWLKWACKNIIPKINVYDPFKQFLGKIGSSLGHQHF